jgi:hypothetical protein
MEIGPFVLTNGSLIPYDEEGRSRQNVIEAEDGSIYVQDRTAAKFIRARIKLNRTEANAVAGYLENGVRYAADAFTLKDDFNVQWNVRLWGGKVRRRSIASNVVEMDLMFRVEVTNR